MFKQNGAVVSLHHINRLDQHIPMAGNRGTGNNNNKSETHYRAEGLLLFSRNEETLSQVRNMSGKIRNMSGQVRNMSGQVRNM